MFCDPIIDLLVHKNFPICEDVNELKVAVYYHQGAVFCPYMYLTKVAIDNSLFLGGN